MKLNDVIGMMVGVYTDWSDHIVNPNFVRNANTITWKGNEHTFFSDRIAPAELVAQIEKKQYTFQIAEDGAIFQLYYVFNSDQTTLNEASLGFYKLSSTDIMEMDPDLHEGDPLHNDSTESNAGVLWLRLDYQPKLARGVLHSDAHLHMAGFPDTRFVVKGVPTPKQFVEFAIASCYPNAYARHRLTEHKYVNSLYARESKYPTFSCQDTDAFDVVPHLTIPGF